MRVELEYGSDFADFFEVKYLLDKRGRTWTEIEGTAVTLWYEHDSYRRGTRLVFDTIEELDSSSARFELVLASRQRWDLCVDVQCVVDGELHRPRAGHGGFGSLEPGTVWPHDTSIVAEGLRRYGAREAATRLAFNLIEAADAFGHQLPEVFAGFPRHDTVIPVEFPTSCKPQAWAAGAVR